MRIWIVSTALLAACSSDSGIKKYNSEPEVLISSHATGDTVVEGVAEIVRGQVGDPNHAIADLSVTWLMNGAETCEDSAPDDEGVVSCEMTFGTDGAEVSLEVRDPEGAGASASVTLEVQPTDAPVAEITAPAADGVYYSDQLITFEGTVSDTEDDVADLTVEWASEIDGAIEGELNTPDTEGGLLGAATLSEGEHFITLTVTDTTGKEGRASTTITVGPPNSNPTCTITAPETGSAGPEGELVTFTGTAEDVDVDADWLAVAWSSDKDGPIGTSTPNSSGAVTFPYADLTVNTHVITMTVTDEIGATCAADTVFTVGTPPVLTVTAPTDGATLNHNDAVVFEATVEDNEDLPNEVTLSWESDLDGVFSTDGADSSGAATVSIDSLSAGDHVVTVTATDTDGLFVTDTVSFNLNQPPTTPTVTLEPDPAATNQMLVATATGSVDPEGTGTVTYAYAWFEDGVATAESASATFPASATGKNHTYRVQVTASDGLVESAFGYAEVNVINSAPALAGPSLSAATAVVGDVLTCSATATDLDPEDSPIVSYAWSDGSTGPSYTVTMADAVDSTITCTATADDADGGVTTGTASATVTNTAPTVDTVTVTPATGQVGDVLTCTATATDADGTTPDITYAWSDGSTGGSYTITASDAVDSTITCTATATDMHGETGIGTASATVTNTAPVMGTMSITPDPAYNDDTLVCTATATDADGTAPDITYAWTGGATTRELPLTSIIAASGDTLTCTATATDAYGETDVGTASITLGNRSPSVTVAISPETPTKSDTLTCTASGVSDPDDDATTVAFTWTVGGSPVAASSTSGTITTLAAAFLAGQTVACRADVDDGKTGTGTDTASVVIGNTAPAVSSVTLTPSSLYTNDTVTAMATTTDDDGDDLTLTYAFSVDGTVVQDGASNTLDGTVHFDKGQVVTVTVTADDGTDTGSDTASGVTVLNSPPTAPTVVIDEGDTVVPGQVAAGHQHTCGVQGDGTAICWGNNEKGQASPPAESFAMVSAGYFHSCGVTESGEAKCWGENAMGEGSPPADVFTKVSAGESHTCGLTTDGTIRCWGDDGDDESSPPSGTFIDVGAGDNHSCGVLASGEAQCWGYSAGGRTVPPDDAFTSVDVGGAHACGVTESGTLECWGEPADGRTSPPSGTFSHVDAGGSHTCGIRTDGSVECWGWNGYGQTSPPVDTFASISLGNHHSCGLTTSGEVKCWGWDSNGQTSGITGSYAEAVAGLVCTIDEDSTDPDGDPITYTFDWDVDGTPFTDTETTSYPSDSVEGDLLGYDEMWTCQVTPYDGDTDGDVATDSFTTENCPAGSEASCPAYDCLEILDDDATSANGHYWVDGGADTAVEVYCDMVSAGGGWTLLTVTAVDGVDTWTTRNQGYWDTSTTTFGSLSSLNSDFKSNIYHTLEFSDLLFHNTRYDEYLRYDDVSDDTKDMGAFIQAIGGRVCGTPDGGHPLTASTLSDDSNMCDTDLYFNLYDNDGEDHSGTCGISRDDQEHGYGPNWNVDNNNGCYFDDPGFAAGLGPSYFQTDTEMFPTALWPTLGDDAVRMYARPKSGRCASTFVHTGDLTISDATPESDYRCARTITGSLNIQSTSSLNAALLDSLESAGAIYINDNVGLESISFRSLKSVSGELKIERNARLTRVYLLGLASAGSQVVVGDNANLCQSNVNELQDFLAALRYAGGFYSFGNNEDC